MSHTIFASFARDKNGDTLHVGDHVAWQGNDCVIRSIKRGGNVTVTSHNLPYSYGVKSRNVVLDWRTIKPLEIH